MKNIVFFFISLLFASIISGQSEKPENKRVTNAFITNYNNENYEGIFAMFSIEMQQALPLEKNNEFLKGLQLQAGKINNSHFVTYENGSYASYKTAFEKGDFSLNISLNKQSKINGFFIRPYTEKVASITINSLSENENNVTNKHKELIFEKTKSFPNNTQLSFAIIKNGTINFYGIKKKNDTILSINNSRTIFEIGSITKVFTATLLANAVLNKKVKLNDAINPYFDFPFYNQTKISFKQLANHTSGLSRLPSNLDVSLNPENPYKDYCKTALDAYLADYLSISESTKNKYEYSNLGAGLLGYTLGKLEGLSFEELLIKDVFTKYKMVNSTTNFANAKGTLIKGLDVEGKEVANWEFNILTGAGGMLSNVEDLSKFAFAQFDASHIDLTLTKQQTFQIDDNTAIGLGWHIKNQNTDKTWYFHSGATGGYTASFLLDCDAKNSIIILSNVSAFNPNMINIDSLSFELMLSLYE